MTKTATRKRAVSPRDINTRAFTALVRNLDAMVSKLESAQVILVSAQEAACECVGSLDYETRLARQRTIRKLSNVVKRGDVLRNHALLYKAELEHLASSCAKGETS